VTSPPLYLQRYLIPFRPVSFLHHLHPLVFNPMFTCGNLGQILWQVWRENFSTDRIVALVNYDFGIMYIRFVGNHEEYNKIDVTLILGEKMNIKPIKTETDYTKTLQTIEKLMGATKRYTGR